LPFRFLFLKFKLRKKFRKINVIFSNRSIRFPINPVPKIVFRQMATNYPITEEQIQFYEASGYVKLENVLTTSEVEELRAALQFAVDDQLQSPTVVTASPGQEYRKVFLQMVNLWERYPAIKKYVFNQKVAEIARRLSRSKNVRLWHDHALIKEPGDSKATAWHQDLPYWPMKQTTALSCWMALDDVTVENGCMHFIPGSHKFGRLDAIDLTSPQDIFALVPGAEGKTSDPVAVPLKAGSCTFHNGLTFHYAGPNKTAKPRRAMVTIYIPAGVTYVPLQHIVGDRSGLKEGDEFEGELFPILASE
jgi:phytanoyl-CoA hydroxylase